VDCVAEIKGGHSQNLAYGKTDERPIYRDSFARFNGSEIRWLGLGIRRERAGC